MKYKSILTGLSIIYFLLGVGHQAHAQSDTLRVWQNINQDSLVRLIDTMKSNEWYTDRQGFTIDGLAWNAYQHEVDNDLLKLLAQEHQTLEGYTELFRERNNFTGEYFPVRDFIELARGPGIYLPDRNLEATAIHVLSRLNIQDEERAVILTRLEEVQAAAQAGNEVAMAEIAEFEGRMLEQVSGLQSSVAELETTQAEHAERLTEHSEQLSTLSADTTEQGSQIADLQVADTALSERVDSQEESQISLQSDVEQLQVTDTELSERVSSQGENQNQLWSELNQLRAIVAGLAILFLLYVVSRRSKKTRPIPIRSVSENHNEPTRSNHQERMKKFGVVGKAA